MYHKLLTSGFTQNPYASHTGSDYLNKNHPPPKSLNIIDGTLIPEPMHPLWDQSGETLGSVPVPEGVPELVAADSPRSYTIYSFQSDNPIVVGMDHPNDSSNVDVRYATQQPWHVPYDAYAFATPGQNPCTDSSDVGKGHYQGLTRPQYPCIWGCPSTSFRRRADQARHKREQHQCSHEDCKGVTFTRSELDDHEKIHSGNEIGYRCGSCWLSNKTKRFKRHEKIKDHMIRVHKKPKYMEVKCSSLSCSSGTHGGMYFDSDSDRQKHFELHHSHDTEGLRYDEAANGSLLPSQDIDENQALPSNHKKRTLDSNIEIVAKREKVMATPMQSSSLSYCRLHTTEHEITLIESIKIGDMCNFLGHPELRSINKELEKCNVKIIFTRSTGAIKIRGTLQEDVLNSAKARLKPLNSFPGSREGDTVPKLHPSATLDLCFKQRKEADNPIEILSIRRSEDIDAVTTWERFISPSLSGILQNAGVRYPYTATFVRQKQKDTLVGPAPVIRFQSSGQTAFQRQKIQEKIKEICLQHRRPPLPVHFYNATMVTLVGDSFQDDPPDDMGIPLQSRYYSQPGMSASIGLSRCNHMFATLGGYVRVGGRLYMLSVWHLIKDADACIQCRNIDTADNRVDSPAPIHVMALKRTLDENIRHSNKQFEDLLTDREDDVDISEWLDTVPKDQLEFRTHWNRWRNELDKGGADFRLGQLEQSSGGLTLHPPSYSRKNDLVIKQHCFDWAIFQVEGPRLGKNRYRYPLGKEVELNCQHFEEEARNPEGIGQFCESSREFRLGEAVYYAGSSKNNYIEGKIHEFPILCRDSQDKEYHEWGIIPDERMSADYFKGDSGALVVAKSDNHILGLLWAYSGDFLLFTPINEVFKQISMSMGNVHVEIARSDRSRALPPTVTTLSGRLAHVFYEKKCGSMEYSKRKQRQYFRLSDKIPPGHGAATATRISADIRSRSPSPVPSLVSSNASLSVSCTSAPSSPGMGSLDSDSETYDLEDPPKDVTIEALPFDLLTSPSSDRKDFPSQLMGGSVKVEA